MGRALGEVVLVEVIGFVVAIEVIDVKGVGDSTREPFFVDAKVKLVGVIGFGEAKEVIEVIDVDKEMEGSTKGAFFIGGGSSIGEAFFI